VTKKNKALIQAYADCRRLAQQHYENFPVASLLLPKRLRQPISVIYAFSRTADDFADEGDAPPEERLKQLHDYSHRLVKLHVDEHVDDMPIFIALKDVVQRFNLPIQLLEDLLIAFRQDVVKSRYQTFDEVLNYCRYSANPVGRLLLHLEGHPSDEALAQSDAICTALQLINFYQDVVQDFTEQDRVYIPQQDLAEHGLTNKDLMTNDTTKLAPLLRQQHAYAKTLMEQGYLLGTNLKGRLGWEVRAMTLGGITTLNMLMQQPDEQLLSRPRLTHLQGLTILWQSMSKQGYINKAKALLDI
jgi:squalene synthase HpnC